MASYLKGSSWLFPTATAATSHGVPLPQYESGDLLLVFISSTNAAVATASGWTQQFAVNRPSSAGKDRLTCLYKTAGADGTSVSVSLDATENMAAICYAVENATGTIESATTTSSGSSTPDPPTLTPAAGSGLYMWFAACATSGARYLTGYPTGFNLSPIPLFYGATSTARTSMAAAAVVETASTKNPGTFPISSTFEWAAATVAVPLTPTGGGVAAVHPLGGA
jgi:hypothetical protein